MGLRPELADESDDMADKPVKTEAFVRERRVADVFPIGDADLVIQKQRAHRAAQQGREMAGHGRDQQHFGLARRPRFSEFQQVSERGCGDSRLQDGAWAGGFHLLPRRL